MSNLADYAKRISGELVLFDWELLCQINACETPFFAFFCIYLFAVAAIVCLFVVCFSCFLFFKKKLVDHKFFAELCKFSNLI